MNDLPMNHLSMNGKSMSNRPMTNVSRKKPATLTSTAKGGATT